MKQIFDDLAPHGRLRGQPRRHSHQTQHGGKQRPPSPVKQGPSPGKGRNRPARKNHPRQCYRNAKDGKLRPGQNAADNKGKPPDGSRPAPGEGEGAPGRAVALVGGLHNAIVAPTPGLTPPRRPCYNNRGFSLAGNPVRPGRFPARKGAK